MPRKENRAVPLRPARKLRGGLAIVQDPEDARRCGEQVGHPLLNQLGEADERSQPIREAALLSEPVNSDEAEQRT